MNIKIQYAVKDPVDGYFCEDEDRIGGNDYNHEFDEYTILFYEREDAERYCYGKQFVVEIHNGIPLK